MAVTWKKIAYYTDALTIDEQEVVGRLTGGSLDGIAIGIADDNILQIDHASVADDDYAKFTANGLEGKSYAEVASDLLGSITAIQDADGDTKIQVEESADEDKIRMDVAGVEAFQLHNAGILSLAKQSSSRAFLSLDQGGIPSGVEIRVNLSAETYDVQNEFDTTTLTGTDDYADGGHTRASHLIDHVKAQFTAADVGKWVWNTTDDTYATVTACNDATDLTLSADIMAVGQTYRLYNSLFTATEAGRYLVIAYITYKANTVDQKQYGVYVRKNGVIAFASITNSSGTTQFTIPIVEIVNMAANEYISLSAYQASASVQALRGLTGATFLSITKLT